MNTPSLLRPTTGVVMCEVILDELSRDAEPEFPLSVKPSDIRDTAVIGCSCFYMGVFYNLSERPYRILNNVLVSL